VSADPRALLRALVLDDDRRWGDVAVDWQMTDADAVLDLAGERAHFQTRPRGGSKTTDLAAVAVVALIDQAPPGSRSYAVAVDAEQADLLVGAMRGFVLRTPGLAGVLEVQARRVVNRQTMAQLEVLPADGASAWGLLPWLMVVDEIGQWPSTRNHRTLWEAVVSSVPKAGPTGRFVCLTSAGEPAHWSYRTLQHARTSPAWRVSEIPGPLPWRTEADLAEQRAMLTASSYQRLHENRWVAAEDRLSTEGDIAQCIRDGGATVLPPERGVSYVIALDVGLTNDRTVVAVGHLELYTELADGTPARGADVVLDRMEVRQGSKGHKVDLGEVEELVAELATSYHRARVVVDPFQAVHLAQGLRRRGIRTREFTFSQASAGRLGLLLYRLLRDGQLDLPDDQELIDELANVRLRETSIGQYRLDHDNGKHDDRAVALALLAHELLEGKPSRRRTSRAFGDQPSATSLRTDLAARVSGSGVYE